MRIGELIDRLTEIQEEHGEIEVKGAFQPRWPLITDLEAVTTLIDEEEETATVFLALGDGDEYGSKSLWDDCDTYTESDDDEEEEEG